MEMYLKLGTLPMKRYQTKEYKEIKINDVIDVLIRGKYMKVKIWKIRDQIPVYYFGGYY